MPGMKHPFLVALAAGLAVLLAAAAAVGWQMWRGPASVGPGQIERGLPWQIETVPGGGTRVFDLTPGVSTLADVQRAQGDALQVALVAKLGEAGALEALLDPFRAGYVTGRLVLAFDAPAEARTRWREGATGSEPMEGGVRRFSLQPAHREEAGAAVLVGLSYVPSVQLTEAVVRERFGEPASRLALGAQAQAWLYPERGLAVTIDAQGRDVLNYVAPAQFDARLAQPLRATAASLAASPAASSAVR